MRNPLFVISSLEPINACKKSDSKSNFNFFLLLDIYNEENNKKNERGRRKKTEKEVLNGGYNVHPVPPPNSEIKERITKRYERERIKIEKLLTLGYTTSGDP